jgi:hypothetical protein
LGKLGDTLFEPLDVQRDHGAVRAHAGPLRPPASSPGSSSPPPA